MKTTWLKRLKQRLEMSRRRTRRHGHGAESLEQRTYLSVSSLFSNGTLIVVADADDSIVVQPDPANTSMVQVLANGIRDTTLPPLQAATIERIEIDAGPGDNLIDLNAVSLADFTFANPATGGGLEILVDGGHGDDTIVGSLDFGDSLFGGDGDDLINDSPATRPRGDQTIDGGDGNDTLTGGRGNDSISGRDGEDEIDGRQGDDSITGGDGNDTLQGGNDNDELFGNAGEDDVRGGDDDDTLHGDSGDDTLTGEDGNDHMFGGSGNDGLGGNAGEDTLHGNSGNDTLLGGADPDSLVGGDGDDVLDSGDQTISVSDVIVNPEGNSGFTLATFTISLSAPSALQVSADVSTVDGAAEDGLDYLGINQTIVLDPGVTSVDVTVAIIGDDLAEFDENFFLVVNNVQNALVADGEGEGIIMDDGDGPVQIVFIDFDSATDPSEIQYTQSMRDAIQMRLEADFGPFNVVFTQTAPIGQTFTTLTYNQSPPFFSFGGIALGGIDFRNLNMGDNVVVNISDFTTNTGLPSTEQNLVAASAVIGAHEIGHAMGLRHRDSWGPVGSGIQQGLAGVLSPPYTGPQNATESFDHLMTTPAGPFAAPISTAIEDLYFGARSAMKLAFYAFEGQVLSETAMPHASIATAQPLSLADLPVPNTELMGALAGLVLDVEATTVLATIGGVGESDFYSFDAQMGDIINIEAISTVTNNPPRYLNTVDTQVSVFDAMGNLVMLGSGDAMNDDELSTDSIILDLIIPADGTYFVEVDAFGGQDTGNYELYVTNFNAVQPTLPPSSATASSTGASDTMEGGAGNDTLGAGSADDLLNGGLGDDLIFAGDGNDLAFGGGGADSIEAGPGDDSIFGNGGTDSLEGEAGNDFVDGGASSDRVFGDDSLGTNFGDDTVVGGSGNDIMFGGAGNDLMFGGSGRDALNGDDGDDTLFGQGSTDTLRGGAGNDDLVWRGAGNDLVSAGTGRDIVDIRGDSTGEIYTVGQNGTSITVTKGPATLTIETLEDELASPVEQIRIRTLSGADTVNIGDVNNFGSTVLLVETGDQNDRVNATGARLGDVRLVIDGGDGDDTLTGSADADTIIGGNGIDSIRGGSGADTLRGGAGDDFLDGQAGHDRLFGESENDVLVGGLGHDTLDGSFGNDTITGGDGMDVITGGFGADSLDGGADADRIEGGAGEDFLAGRGGNDTLDGGRNDDLLLGNGGNDKLRGDHGHDIIRGHSGNDTASGGDGDDSIFGGGGRDGIDAGDGNDNVVGDLGQDTIVGGDGDDNLIGGGSTDIIFGQDGDDALNGNSGQDTLVLGEGLDVVVPSATDTVFGDEDEFPLTAALLNKLDASD